MSGLARPADTSIAPHHASRPEARAIPGPQKAAIIVRLLLADGGALPLQALPANLQTALTEQIGAMRSVDRATLRSVVEEFLTRLDSVGLSFPGGIERALDLLDGHISPAAANEIRSQRAASTRADPWERIAALPKDRLLQALGEESVEVGAVILSKLAVARAAELLGLLPGDRARRLAVAIGRTAAVRPDTVKRIGQSLIGQLAAIPPRAFDSDPEERMGAILNVSPAGTRNAVLDGLNQDDADFAGRVRARIFTFADISQRIEARDVPRITRGVDQATLITALAAATDDKDRASAEFILANLSQRMAATLREEMAARGAVKPKDADAAQAAMVGAVRALLDTGEITMRTAEENEG